MDTAVGIAQAPVGRKRLAGRIPGASLAFVLVNQSSNSGLTSDVLHAIASACEAQLDNELATEWGGRYLVRVAAVGTAAYDPLAEVPIFLQDALPVPDALGYHDVFTKTGRPVAYIAVAGVTDFTGSVNALSVTISHELCETAVDPTASRWQDNARGQIVALEVCDQVEATGYRAPNGVWVSNFLWQSYFAPGSVGPYDQMGLVTFQGQELDGGYAIVATAPMDTHDARMLRQIGGGHPAYLTRMPTRNLAKKAHLSSRTSRRGVMIRSVGTTWTARLVP